MISNGAYQNYKGTKDYLPIAYTNINNYSSELYRFIEQKFIETCNTFACDEIIIPTIEFAKMYNRSIGEATDIVQKEMFIMASENKKDLCLRPEGTASVVRSYIQNKVYASPNEIVKLYYKGSMFRKENPQAGRQREFTQLGIEYLGIESPAIDAEMIALISNFLQSLNLKNIELQINSIGCSTYRESYKKNLMEYLSKINDLCEDCNERITRNPLRTLDCKNNNCRSKLQNAPLISQYLCNNCSTDYNELKNTLDLWRINYTENPKLVRGLDYYAKTAFEFIDTSIGAQSTVCGGGRYNTLIEDLGGPSMTGVGCAIGLERILISLDNQSIQLNLEKPLDYYLIWTNEQAKYTQMTIAMNLRSQGYRVEMEYSPKKMKAQFKIADRKKAKRVLILGEDELSRNIIGIKDLETGNQIEDDLNKYLL